MLERCRGFLLGLPNSLEAAMDRIGQDQEEDQGGEGVGVEAEMLLRVSRAWDAGEDGPATRRHVCFIAEILMAMRGFLGIQTHSKH